MKEQFVTYEIALKLKELGFDEECFAIFTDNSKELLTEDEWLYSTNNETMDGCKLGCTAPLWQQVIDWFRKNGIYVEIRFVDRALTLYEFCIFRNFKEKIKLGDNRLTYKSYEEAREQAIFKAIKMIKKENNK